MYPEFDRVTYRDERGLLHDWGQEYKTGKTCIIDEQAEAEPIITLEEIIDSTIDTIGRAAEIAKDIIGEYNQIDESKYYGWFTHYVCLKEEALKLIERNNNIINSVKEGKLKNISDTTIEISEKIRDTIYLKYHCFKRKPDCKGNKERCKALKDVYKQAQASHVELYDLAYKLKYK